jgi:hypothetical protein
MGQVVVQPSCSLSDVPLCGAKAGEFRFQLGNDRGPRGRTIHPFPDSYLMNSLHNVFRRLRRRASKAGYCLRSFRQIHGPETELGPEWLAECIRHPHLAVVVWRPYSDDDIAEAERTCEELIVTERFRSTGRPSQAFGVSWLGKWPAEVKR